MRRLLFLILTLLLLILPHSSKAEMSVWCTTANATIFCFSGRGPTLEIADRHAETLCKQSFSNCSKVHKPSAERCITIASASNPSQAKTATEETPELANKLALATCAQESNETCRIVFSGCDDPPPVTAIPLTIFSYFNLGTIGTGISSGIGIILALLVYAKRAAIANIIIHGNLPYKLPVYGEDIQCLFKRTQRVNWYGRVVFGIVVNLAMTHQQLIDVRKYWLGCVIAFDSLRRQRQNELARMHLQLAASVTSDPHDKKKFWSRRWATIRTFIRRLFWIFTALFSFLFGFFFIRVTIAKLVQGTIIESKDLVLILQAKDVIEESTTYLKEYLTTANTFDGGDEIYEPK
jgi:Domain of unknown function (DUF4189)